MAAARQLKCMPALMSWRGYGSQVDAHGLMLSHVIYDDEGEWTGEEEAAAAKGGLGQGVDGANFGP